MGDVPPARFAGFGRGSALTLPWHEHVWGQLDVLVVFGQREEWVAARVALWQGQSHVRVLRLRWTEHIRFHAPTDIQWLVSKFLHTGTQALKRQYVTDR